MNEPTSVDALKHLSNRRLKQCPVCDALTENTQQECFVCSWHGEFLQDPELIEASLLELMCASPEVNAVISGDSDRRSSRQSVRRILGRVFRRRLDVRV